MRAHDMTGRLNDDAPPEARWAVLTELLTELRRSLDERQYAAYTQVLQREFRAYLLNPANETAIARLMESYFN